MGKFRGYGSACFALRYSPNGDRLAGGYFDGCVRVFDVDKKIQLHNMSLTRPNGAHLPHLTRGAREAVQVRIDEPSITNLRWAPNARSALLAVTDIKGTVGIWDLTRGREPRLVCKTQTGAELNAIAFTHDGSRLMVGGSERVVKVYDLHGGVLSAEFSSIGNEWSGVGCVAGHAMKVLSICAHPFAQEVCLSGGLDKQVLVWDQRNSAAPVAAINGVELSGDSMDISRDGMTLLVGSHRHEEPLQLYDLRCLSDASSGSVQLRPWLNYSWNGDPVSSRGAPQNTPTCMIFSASWDGENKFIAAAGEKENSGRIFQRSSGDGKPLTVVATVNAQDGVMFASAISADGRNAAFGNANGVVRSWSIR